MYPSRHQQRGASRRGRAWPLAAALGVAAAALTLPAPSAGAVGTPPVPDRISAGYSHSCAVDDAGDVRCWGLDGSGQLGYPNSVGAVGDSETPASVGAVDVGAPATAVEVGDVHTCAILVGGTVRCWGSGAFGQTGLGSTSVTVGDDEDPADFDYDDNSPGLTDPIYLGEGRRAIAIAAGSYHTCAIVKGPGVNPRPAGGDVVCWGDGSEGQLGYGDLNGDGLPDSVGDDKLPGDVGPVRLGLGRTALQITAGFQHTCAVLDDFTVKCWGNGSSGQLGYGSSIDSVGVTNTPGQVGVVSLGKGRTATAIAAGGLHTCVILDNRTVKCWGFNEHGELGYAHVDDDIGNGRVPSNVRSVDLGAGHTAESIAAGFFHTCAVLDDDSVRCWGQNEFGVLGIADIADIGDDETPGSASTVDLDGHGATAVEAGLYHTCAVVDAGDVYCWGKNDDGVLGLGNTFEDIVGDDETPADVGPIELGGLLTA